MFFNDAMGEIESHIDISHTKRLSTAVYSFLSQTSQTQNLVLTRAACIYLCFSPLLVSSLKQSVFIFERVTSKKTKFIVIVIIFLLRKIYIWFKYSKISEERVVTPNNLVIFVESFQTGINFLFGQRNNKVCIILTF